ncbi:MAG: DNA-3-methyladenine glycosylase 2 family protein [Spirochaetaceae bacterium]|nr:MAG: DNA-3-methyladenine glycosylase 2 family protein [Spirochaetaceae bacterium]
MYRSPTDHEPPYWADACAALAAADPVLAELIERHRADVLTGSGDGFRTLLNAIVGQQISVSAAASIWGRLTDLLPGLSPGDVAAAAHEALRAVGLSNRKAEYVVGIARAFADGSIDPDAWVSMDDADVTAQLVSLRGVGPWTAQMVLIFHLHRPDVLPTGDIGLVNAAARLYGWTASTLPGRAARLRDHAERWRPWRTVATWYIWRDLDAEPVIY